MVKTLLGFFSVVGLALSMFLAVKTRSFMLLNFLCVFSLTHITRQQMQQGSKDANSSSDELDLRTPARKEDPSLQDLPHTSRLVHL
jgi:hypothetical protein